MSPNFQQPMYELYCDGATSNNQHAHLRQSGIGCALYDPQGECIATYNDYIGNRTNNEAEYEALIAGLAFAFRNGIQQVRICLDAELVVDQMKYFCRCKEPRLQVLHAEAHRGLEQYFSYFELQHIPREENKHADRLANQAINEHRARMQHNQQQNYCY